MDYSSDSKSSNSEEIDISNCENLYDNKQSDIEEIISEFEEIKEDYENKLVILLERYNEIENKRHHRSFCSCHFDDYEFDIIYEHQKLCYKIEEYQNCISELETNIEEFKKSIFIII